MLMVALESENSSPLFKLQVELLGLPCKFSKSTWERHVKKFKTAYQSAANEVLLKSREKVCDLIPEDESGLTPVKIGLMVLGLREDSDPYLVQHLLLLSK